MQKGRTVTLHIVSSLDGFIAKKDNGSPGWRVLEASTKPVLEQRSFTKRKLKFCDTLSKHLSFDKRAGYVNFHQFEFGNAAYPSTPAEFGKHHGVRED